MGPNLASLPYTGNGRACIVCIVSLELLLERRKEGRMLQHTGAVWFGAGVKRVVVYTNRISLAMQTLLQSSHSHTHKYAWGFWNGNASLGQKGELVYRLA